MGNGASGDSGDSDTFTDKVSPMSLLEEFESSVHKHSHVSVWWPRDEKAYAGKILDIQDKSTPDGESCPAITVLYEDGDIQKYPMDTVFYNRVAIGKVTQTCIEVTS